MAALIHKRIAQDEAGATAGYKVFAGMSINVIKEKHTMEEELEVQIGIDWADEKHDYCLCGGGSEELQTGVIRHDPVQLHEWIRQLRQKYPQGRFAVCLESSRGALVEVLREFSFIDLYPVNPITANRFRESLYPSLSKDDPTDARLLLDILRKHRDRLRRLPEADPKMHLLDGLVRSRRSHVDRRTRLVQTLTATLKEYYPQALEMAANLGSPLSIAFLRRWPDWSALAKSRAQTLVKFYQAHSSRSESCMRARLELHATSTALTQNAVTIELGILKMHALVDQIEQLNKTIATHDKRIAEVYAQMDQKHICDSFPGAGKAMAPRLMVAMACHAGLCRSAQELAAYSGVAPVRQRSGKIQRIGKRFRVPHFLHQTFLELAHWSISKSVWANQYYHYRKDVLKEKHWAILRSLAFKWIRIFFACWQTGTPYDENQYLETLRKRGSPFAA
jgi:transposase